MAVNTETSIRKYEERFIRKLGEIAILIHLAKSPEGSHAYELRFKASEIIFERRRVGTDMLEQVFEILLKLKEIHTKEDSEGIQDKDEITEISEMLNQFPVLKFNSKIQKFLSNDVQISKEDIGYLSELIDILNDMKKDMQESTEIWSNSTSIYPAIESLEKNGLIRLDREDPEGGRLKKIYKITDLGEESLERVMLLLIDILSFVLETEGRNFLFGGKSIFSSKIIPIRKLLEKLLADLGPNIRKDMLSLKSRKQSSTLINMMLTQVVATPMLNTLIRNPEMLEDQFESIEEDEEKKMFQAVMKNKLIEQREMIDKMLKKL